MVTYLVIAAILLSQTVVPRGCQAYQGGCKPITPRNAVAWFDQSGIPGEGTNIVLYGHNPGVFSELPQVKIGDEVVVEGVTYRVTEIFVVPDGEGGQYIGPTDDERVTLVTCVGDDRLIVIAR